MVIRTKRLLSVLALSIICFLVVNCSAVLTPLPVGVYTNAKFPLDFESGYSGSKNYKILGSVTGKATANSILGLFSTGDASIAAAYQNAIAQYPEADCLIEIAIDYSANSFLGLFASITTIVKGKAIQFQKLSSQIEELKEVEPKYHKKVVVNKEKKNMAAKKLAQQKNKDVIEPPLQIPSGLDIEKLAYIGNWELISIKSPDGKRLESESNLKGSLFLSKPNRAKLIFDQSGRKIVFEGKFHFEDNASMTIEVEQVDSPQPRTKIYYKNVHIKDTFLILKSKTGREYYFKK